MKGGYVCIKCTIEFWPTQQPVKKQSKFDLPGPPTDSHGNIIGDEEIPIIAIDHQTEPSTTSYKTGQVITVIQSAATPRIQVHIPRVRFYHIVEVRSNLRRTESKRASNPTRKNDSGNIPDGPDSIKSHEHLIETEYLPNLRQTAYRCKEHPDVPYYDLEGIKESHFKPYHTEK